MKPQLRFVLEIEQPPRVAFQNFETFDKKVKNMILVPIILFFELLISVGEFECKILSPLQKSVSNSF